MRLSACWAISVLVGLAGCGTPVRPVVSVADKTVSPSAVSQVQAETFELTWLEDTAFARQQLARSGRPAVIRTHHRAVVPVYLDGRGPYNMEVDTGADTTFVSADVLNLSPSDYLSTTSGIGGTLPVARITVKELRVGKFALANVNVAAGNWRSESVEQGKIVGLLGQNVLAHFKVTFDYPNKRLILEYAAP